MRRTIIALLLLCLCTASITSADPITIASGQFVLNQNSGSFQFNGVGLDAGSTFLITGSRPP